jgi:hypothetical protein
MILDVLNNQNPEFTVNTAATSVAAALTSVNQPFLNANGNSLFAAGDNVKIRTIALYLPFQFGAAAGQHAAGIQFGPVPPGPFPIPELGNFSTIDLAPPCDKLEIDLFVIGRVAANFSIVLSSIALNVSMLNVPPVLNGVTLNGYYQIVVEHTIALI